MALLSKGKLDFFKTRKKLTNKQIATLSGVTLSNIDKIFSGVNKNPSFDTITEIANVLDCEVDELIESDSAISPYYTEKDLAKLAKQIKETKYLNDILKYLVNLPENDLVLLQTITERLSN